jgi:(p)ppGpp synthase/HD superfamily hydrolase
MLYTNGQLLSSMLVFATTYHNGQFDKSGKPYILHPLKVMHYLKTNDEELQCIALGHDLIEDTDATYDLILLNFGVRVANGIRTLTKVDGESYEDYKKKVLRNIDAMTVKKADLRHNTDIRRLKGITDKDMARTLKYYEFYLEIERELENYEQ